MSELEESACGSRSAVSLMRFPGEKPLKARAGVFARSGTMIIVQMREVVRAVSDGRIFVLRSFALSISDNSDRAIFNCRCSMIGVPIRDKGACEYFSIQIGC